MDITNSLIEKLVIDKKEFMSFIHTAPKRYKRYPISKRNSDEKRMIAQPSKEVKFIQKLLINELRNIFEIHHNAHAYEIGKSIKSNAMPHINSRFLLKMDFKDFFPSITPDLLFNISNSIDIIFSEEDKDLLSHLLFWKLRSNSPLRLSIGAPSSPFISNFVMRNFDKALTDICTKKNINYTRYADDITFTTNKKNILFEIPKIVKILLKIHCMGHIKINHEKTVYSSKSRNRHITGVTLTNDNKLSVGRKRKRSVSSLIHKFSLSKLSPEEVINLRGQLAFINSIEPSFIIRMNKKYGNNLLTTIMKRD